MKYPLNAYVHCTDGLFGRSTHLIFNPATGKVTHLVVKEKNSPHAERLLPTRWIKEKTPDILLVNRTKAELRSLQQFHQKHFIQRSVCRLTDAPDRTMLWPYVVPDRKRYTEEHDAVPQGELAVWRGMRVRATDGRIGQVDEFLVNAESGHITHLILREGLLIGRKQVMIPLSAIDDVEKDTVCLKLTKQEVKQLPAIPIQRKDVC